MSEPQAFDSSKPFTVVSATPPPQGVHPEARMSAGQPGLAWPGGDDQKVTLADLQADPIGAMKQIAASIGRDVSDPKLWLGMAASYFAPKMFSAAAPVVARAAAAVGRGAAAVEPSDIIGMVPRQVRTAATVAQKVGTAMRGSEPSTAPSVAAPPASPVASGPVAPAPQAAAQPPPVASAPPQTVPPATSAPPPIVDPAIRVAGNGLPDQKALNEAALAIRRQAYQARTASTAAPEAVAAPLAETAAKVKLNGAEYQAFMSLLKRGMSAPDAMKNVLMQRELVATLGTSTPTAAQTRFPKGMRGKVSEP